MSEPKEKSMNYDYRRREWIDKNTKWVLPKSKLGVWYSFSKPQPGVARYLGDGWAEIKYDGMPYNTFKARSDIPDGMCPEHLVDYVCEEVLQSCPPQYPFGCPVRGCKKGKMVTGSIPRAMTMDDLLF